MGAISFAQEAASKAVAAKTKPNFFIIRPPALKCENITVDNHFFGVVGTVEPRHGQDGVIEPDREKGIGLIAEAASEGSKDALDLLLELDEDDFDGDEDEAGDDGENGESE